MQIGDPVTLYWYSVYSYMLAVVVNVDVRGGFGVQNRNADAINRATTYRCDLRQENVHWIRGHHAEDSEAFRALVAAAVLRG